LGLLSGFWLLFLSTAEKVNLTVINDNRRLLLACWVEIHCLEHHLHRAEFLLTLGGRLFLGWGMLELLLEVEDILSSL
jgi:hypothetical protein